MTIDDALETALTMARLLPFHWRARNCGFWSADYIVTLTGRDPGADWRQSFSDMRGAVRATKQEGGLVELVRKGMGSAGVPEVEPLDRRRGDVVVCALDDMSAVCGLDLGKLYAFRLEAGVEHRRDAEVLARFRPLI